MALLLGIVPVLMVIPVRAEPQPLLVQRVRREVLALAVGAEGAGVASIPPTFLLLEVMAPRQLDAQPLQRTRPRSVLRVARVHASLSIPIQPGIVRRWWLC